MGGGAVTLPACYTLVQVLGAGALAFMLLAIGALVGYIGSQVTFR